MDQGWSRDQSLLLWLQQIELQIWRPQQSYRKQSVLFTNSLYKQQCWGQVISAAKWWKHRQHGEIRTDQSAARMLNFRCRMFKMKFWDSFGKRKLALYAVLWKSFRTYKQIYICKHLYFRNMTRIAIDLHFGMTNWHVETKGFFWRFRSPG